MFFDKKSFFSVVRVSFVRKLVLIQSKQNYSSGTWSISKFFKQLSRKCVYKSPYFHLSFPCSYQSKSFFCRIWQCQYQSSYWFTIFSLRFWYCFWQEWTLVEFLLLRNILKMITKRSKWRVSTSNAVSTFCCISRIPSTNCKSVSNHVRCFSILLSCLKSRPLPWTWWFGKRIIYWWFILIKLCNMIFFSWLTLGMPSVTWHLKLFVFQGKNVMSSTANCTDLVIFSLIATAQKMKFSIKYFFSKCDQIRWEIKTWSHLLKKSLMENFILCAVKYILKTSSFFEDSASFKTLFSFFKRMKGF